MCAIAASGGLVCVGRAALQLLGQHHMLSLCRRLEALVGATWCGGAQLLSSLTSASEVCVSVCTRAVSNGVCISFAGCSSVSWGCGQRTGYKAQLDMPLGPCE
jgi:hypothetical protein